jgi:hypothetical protein
VKKCRNVEIVIVLIMMVALWVMFVLFLVVFMLFFIVVEVEVKSFEAIALFLILI